MTKTQHAEPFAHWILDGFLPPERVAELYAEVPPADWQGWEARYDNDCEAGKRTARDGLPASLAAELDWLHRRCWLTCFAKLTGIEYLISDPQRHGAGLHVTDAGGWLGQHLDYALHPTLAGLERRVNLIVFLNPEWREEWGGAFELGDDMGDVVKRITPAPGRAVVWLPGDTAFHGTQRTAEDAPPRATLAVYYLGQARAGASRKRALFVPNREPG